MQRSLVGSEMCIRDSLGWAPHPKEERFDVDGEWLLTKMPQVIYLRFEDAPWTIHPDLGKGVYPMSPVTRVWIGNKTTKVRVRRTGFFLVPDFATTAHMIQGQSVIAAFMDLVTGDEAEKPTDDSQVSAYVMLSRTKDPNKLWLLRPFPRELFTRGPPTGPHVLLKTLRGELQLTDVEAEIKRIEDEKETKAGTDMDPMKKLYRCTQCLLTNQKTFMKPAIAFGANSAAEVSTCIHRHGAWTRCLTCQEVASTRRGCEITPTVQCVDPKGIRCDHCRLLRPLHYYDKSTQKNRKYQRSIAAMLAEVPCYVKNAQSGNRRVSSAMGRTRANPARRSGAPPAVRTDCRNTTTNGLGVISSITRLMFFARDATKTV